ncbi:hypothetical protein [Arthrobacter pascens]|uniref:hypothetical protein n=1 Tax=Arthrobacter pascens TaxID=1677 RepID=UPI00196AD336|nr:hypothetical protein [Arthrobacter pascens]MBN3499306.1 hypothetical protein [Arthrobacter pascens]
MKIEKWGNRGADSAAATNEQDRARLEKVRCRQSLRPDWQELEKTEFILMNKSEKDQLLGDSLSAETGGAIIKNQGGGIVKRRSLLRIGSLITAVSGAYAFSASPAEAAENSSPSQPASGDESDTIQMGLIHAARNPDLLIVGEIIRNEQNVITSATVIWPDGTTGYFTTDVIDASGAINAYHISYGSRTFTQPPIKRNASGAAVAVPQIVVS